MHISQPLQADNKSASSDTVAPALAALRQSRRMKRLLWGCVAIGICIAAGLGLWQMTAPPVVDVQTMSLAPVERVLAVTGRVRSQETIHVYARAAGQIVSLTKKEGQFVSVGEKLGSVDPARAMAEVAQSTAAVSAQRRVVAQAERDLLRAQTLRASGTVADAAVEAATLNVTKGRDDLRRLEAALDEAKVLANELVIISPITGRILNRPVDAGQIVDTRTAIFTIAPASGQDVEAEVDEAYSMALRVGQDVRLAFAGITDIIKGTTGYIAPEVQTSTGGRLVRFSFAPPQLPAGAEIPFGLSVDVNVIVDQMPEAITVPRQAIRRDGAVSYVLLVADNEVARRDIAFIDWPAASVVVTKGLKPGDRVITTQQAYDVGTKVKVRP